MEKTYIHGGIHLVSRYADRDPLL